MRFHMKLQADSEVMVSFRYDDDPQWHTAAVFKAKTYRTHVVPICPRRCQKYRYRLEGCGGMTLVAESKTLGLGSDIRGGI